MLHFPPSLPHLPPPISGLIWPSGAFFNIIKANQTQNEANPFVDSKRHNGFVLQKNFFFPPSFPRQLHKRPPARIFPRTNSGSNKILPRIPKEPRKPNLPRKPKHPSPIRKSLPRQIVPRQLATGIQACTPGQGQPRRALSSSCVVAGNEKPSEKNNSPWLAS